MDKILEVKNLKISFRTQSGTLKAVRDISFDLERGETLAIVGESGSGKSVTSKAILGILAGNSIVEGGEIIFDGKDLLKIDEEEMHKIRGDKIAMIFQNPLNSLNSIVKTGKQITEAMLLKNKAARASAKKEFNSFLAILKEKMIEAVGSDSADKIAEIISTFDKFNIEGIKLEEPYNEAVAKANELVAEIDEFIFNVEKKQKINVKEELSDMIKALGCIKNDFLTAGRESEIDGYISSLVNLKKTIGANKAEISQGVLDFLAGMRGFVSSLLEQPRPDFFRIGYYVMKNPSATVKGMPIDELNEMTLKYLDDNFMTEFIKMESLAIKHSFNASIEGKKQVVAKMPEIRAYFAGKSIDKKTAKEFAKSISELVYASIDKLDVVKDSMSYTFSSSLDSAIDRYFSAVVNNPKEEARFARQTAQREALIARGKSVEWKLVPKVVYDLDELIDEILKIIDSLAARLQADIANADKVDLDKKAIELIDHLKVKASQVVYRLTKRIAKEKAIKLMDEVGIPNARIRYNQYPFQLSGGMRQRVVIAIALSADPDILVCDEPTTALDVTIQAQILELINDLKVKRNLSVIFITHDLGVVANVADNIAVMYAGKVVEYGNAEDIFYDPRHPYTWALLSSMPDLDTNEKLEAIPGTPPNMIYPPVGDAFADRNKYALKIDFEQQPPKFEVSPTHWAATWLMHPNAPKVEPPYIIRERIERMTKRGGGKDE